MTTMQTGYELFTQRTDAVLQGLKDAGEYKFLETIHSPMGPIANLEGYGDVLVFCSNNYLGLADHPEVVAAGIEGIKKYGAGTASVRFICGTFQAHHELEETIAKFMGTESALSFVSCWNANEAIFPTLSEPGDLMLSDELNHASIIDGIRLIRKGVKKAVYKHSDMDSLREKLEEAKASPEITGAVWVVTDGVFSMEGDLAKLPEIRQICNEYGAMLVVDDSHGTGVMGETGRGTHEFYNLPGTAPEGIDFFTGTLGKALGGGAGGYVAGPKRATEMLIQKARPGLFSNALPCTIACSAKKAIEILMAEPERVKRLRDNTKYARDGIRAAGFEVIESPTAICPIIVGETSKAISMSKRLLELGVFVIGFGFPVVPEGEARLRVQISAAHTTDQLDQLIEALKKL
jgi:glycine C-acetyltransferase